MSINMRYQNYHLFEKISEDAFAETFKALDTTTGELVCLKVSCPGFDKYVEQEREAGEKTGGKYLLKVLGGEGPTVATEMADSTLAKAFQENGQKPFSEEQAKVVVCQVFRGLRELHQSGLVHGNLSPDDVLLFKCPDLGPTFPYTVKLGGLCAPPQKAAQVAQQWSGMFQAPEVIQNKAITLKADVWAAAAIGVWMLSGKAAALDGPAAVAKLDLCQISTDFKTALRACLTPAPDWRADISNILTLPVFKDVPEAGEQVVSKKTFTPLDQIDVKGLGPAQIATMLVSLLRQLQELPTGIYDMRPSMLLVDNATNELKLINSAPLKYAQLTSQFDLLSMQGLKIHDEDSKGSLEESAWSVACLGFYLLTGQLPFADKNLRSICHRIEKNEFVSVPDVAPASSALMQAITAQLTVIPLTAQHFINRMKEFCDKGCQRCARDNTKIKLLQKENVELRDELAQSQLALGVLKRQVLELKQQLEVVQSQSTPKQDVSAQPVQRILKPAAIPTQPQSRQCTCGGKSTSLYMAADDDCIECCHKFIGEAGRFFGEYTSLMRAAFRGYADIVKLLVQFEAKMQNEKGQTALMSAVFNQKAHVIDYLLPQETMMQNNLGFTALMAAASKNCTPAIRALIQYEKRMRNKFGQTALMIAAQKGNMEAVKLLIDAEKQMKNNKGETACKIALNCGHLDIAEFLRDHGDDDGQSVVSDARSRFTGMRKQQPTKQYDQSVSSLFDEYSFQ